MPDLIWVVETTITSIRPSIKQYTLLGRVKNGIRISMRGHPKVIKRAAGRYFFTPDEGRAWLLEWARQKRDSLLRLALEMERIIKGDEHFEVTTIPDTQPGLKETKSGRTKHTGSTNRQRTKK